MRARFWTFVNGDWVRVTLRPGQTLVWGYGGPTEEGSCWGGYSWHFDGEFVIESWWENQRDCDGRTSDNTESECRIDLLDAEPSTPLILDQHKNVIDYWRPRRPLWEPLGYERRDFAAEAAGY